MSNRQMWINAFSCFTDGGLKSFFCGSSSGDSSPVGNIFFIASLFRLKRSWHTTRSVLIFVLFQLQLLPPSSIEAYAGGHDLVSSLDASFPG